MWHSYTNNGAYSQTEWYVDYLEKQITGLEEEEKEKLFYNLGLTNNLKEIEK